MATPELPKQLSELNEQLKQAVDAGQEISDELIEKTQQGLTDAKEALKSATATQRTALLEHVNSMQDTLKNQLEKHPEIKELLDSLRNSFRDQYLSLLSGGTELPKTIWEKVGNWVANIADWVQKNPQIMSVLAMFGIAQAKPKENEAPTAAPQTTPNATPTTTNQAATQNTPSTNTPPPAPTA